MLLKSRPLLMLSKSLNPHLSCKYYKWSKLHTCPPEESSYSPNEAKKSFVKTELRRHAQEKQVDDIFELPFLHFMFTTDVKL